MLRTNVGQNLGFQLGAGNDQLTVDSGLVSGSLLQYGSGNETVVIDGGANTLQVKGHVSLNEVRASLAVNVSLDPSGAIIYVGDFLSIIRGSGNNAVHVGSYVQAGESFGMKLGSRNDSVTMSSNDDAVGGSLFQSGSGNETISIGPGLLVEGFTRFQETGPTSALSASIEGASIGKYLSLAAGAGTSSISVINTAVGTVVPDNLGMSLAGNCSVSLSGDTVAGSAFIIGAGTDTISITGTTAGKGVSLGLAGSSGADSITLQADSMAGSLAVATGADNDTISVSDSIINASTTIYSGGGTDVLALGGTAGGGTGTDFFGPVAVTMGDSEGNLTLGASATELAAFFASVSFSGGFAFSTNTFTQTAADYLGAPPTVI
jgi:hypothetical protein